MDISIIIVSWNAKDYLFKCLKSIESKLAYFSSWEIIVIDNDSSDGSPEMIQSEFKNVTLIKNNKNLGFAKANNIGIRKSKGEFIFLINSDIEILDNTVTIMFNYMKLNEKIGMLGPKTIDRDRNIRRSCMKFPTLWNKLTHAFALEKLFLIGKYFPDQLMTNWNYNETKNVEVINGCFWLVRKRAIKQVGLLDENYFMYGEDIDWCKRFHQNNWEVVFLPKAETIHHGGASSSHAPLKFYLEMQRANIQYWKKYNGSLSCYMYKAILTIHHLIRIFGHLPYSVYKHKTNLLKIKRSIIFLMWLYGNKNTHKEFYNE